MVCPRNMCMATVHKGDNDYDDDDDDNDNNNNNNNNNRLYKPELSCDLYTRVTVHRNRFLFK